MNLDVISKIGVVIDRVLGRVDNLVTSDEERQELRNELEALRIEFAKEILEAELALAERRASIIETEAKGESWLQRSWRPVTMLTFLVIIVLHHAGALAFPVTDQMWELLQIGIGGYVVSRGIEKAAPAIADSLRRPPAG
jgi:hypothetical protein